MILRPLGGHANSSVGSKSAIRILLEAYPDMPKISVEVPQELLDDLDEHVGEDKKFVNRSEAVRASIRKTLDRLDDIDERHGRIEGA